MASFDLALARKFAEVAQCLVAKGLDDTQSRRAVAYISRLSMELSLKNFMEGVGIPLSTIRKHSHDLRALTISVGDCEVEVEIVAGHKLWVPASRLRSTEIKFLGHAITLGTILEAEDNGASKYPTELRYGESPKDLPPEALAAGAEMLCDWVSEHSKAARRPASTSATRVAAVPKKP